MGKQKHRNPRDYMNDNTRLNLLADALVKKAVEIQVARTGAVQKLAGDLEEDADTGTLLGAACDAIFSGSFKLLELQTEFDNIVNAYIHEQTRLQELRRKN